MSEGGTSYKGKVRREKVYDKPKTYTMPASSGAQTARILLTGKLQLPQGFGNAAKESKSVKVERRMEVLSLSDNTNSQSQEEAGDSNSSGEGSDDEDDHDAWSESEAKGRRSETPEEKKLRKTQLKEERRIKRQQKKQLKGVFKAEYVSQVAHKAKVQDINSVRVFKYTV
jgi:hypothetical protein